LYRFWRKVIISNGGIVDICELLGLAFNESIDPKISFMGFRQRGEHNPHGWGIAFYPDESAQVLKEPIKTRNSELCQFISKYEQIRSKIIIAHVRLSSGSPVAHKNTHPFHRELHGREFVFAHNGTLNNYEVLRTGRFCRVGDTDSEYAFCFLLNCISERLVSLSWTPEEYEWLHNRLLEVNEFGSFNCLLSDGKRLFCYRDMGGYNDLRFIHRKSPFGSIRLLDQDFEVDLAGQKRATQRGYVVATRPLTNEIWHEFREGELVVIENGDEVFSSS